MEESMACSVKEKRLGGEKITTRGEKTRKAGWLAEWREMERKVKLRRPRHEEHDGGGGGGGNVATASHVRSHFAQELTLADSSLARAVLIGRCPQRTCTVQLYHKSRLRPTANQCNHKHTHKCWRAELSSAAQFMSSFPEQSEVDKNIVVSGLTHGTLFSLSLTRLTVWDLGSDIEKSEDPVPPNRFQITIVRSCVCVCFVLVYTSVAPKNKLFAHFRPMWERIATKKDFHFGASPPPYFSQKHFLIFTYFQQVGVSILDKWN